MTRRRPLSAILPDRGPGRLLAVATLVTTTGDGIYLTGGAIFLVHSAHIPAAQVGVGLTLAGLTGLAAGVVLGDGADRRGARRVYGLTLCVEAAAMTAFALTRSFGVFLAAAALGAIGDSGSRSSRGALIALIGGARRVVLRAQLRSVTNVGVSLGALVAGAALAVDTRAGYVTMILADAATFLVAAALVARLPDFPPTRAAIAAGERRWIALGDRPYLAVTAVNAVLSLNYTILIVGLPLWVAGHTAAPTWIVAPLFLVNTLAIVALQVRVSRGVTAPTVAAAFLRRAGVAFLLAWTAIGVADGAGAVAAVALLAAAVAVHTLGELWQASASFELSFALAREHAQGQYQGVFNLGHGLADALGPVLATGVAIAAGAAGWVALGGMLAVTGALGPAVVAWATRAAVAPARQPA